MLDREFRIRFTLKGVMRFLVSPLFIVPIAVLVLLVPWGGEHVPAWVQALGSILALIVAIEIPQRMQKAEARVRDHGHAMRLFTVIWEAIQANAQLMRQEEEFQGRRDQQRDALTMLHNVMNGTTEEVILGLSVLQRDVDFFQRIMQRASNNLDDDLNVQRQAIAAKFRFNLSVLISALEFRVNKAADGSMLTLLRNADRNFREDLKQLVEISPQLDGALG